jgi:hypothetical protein
MIVTLKKTGGVDEVITLQNDRHQCSLRPKSKRKISQVRQRFSEELLQVIWLEIYAQAQVQPIEAG